ncbi:MAG TPA: hypothetical protein PLB89_05030 [Flavobacteriales bacterium]|nr:hypothetical protein [Flavobacteriales bacterium]
MTVTCTIKASELRVGQRFILLTDPEQWFTATKVKALTKFTGRLKGYTEVDANATDGAFHTWLFSPTHLLELDKAGMNRDLHVKQVRHADLVRVGNSPHSSECPSCGDGVLPMRRDFPSGKLMNTDSCLLCGQQFYYTDIP